MRDQHGNHRAGVHVCNPGGRRHISFPEVPVKPNILPPLRFDGTAAVVNGTNRPRATKDRKFSQIRANLTSPTNATYNYRQY